MNGVSQWASAISRRTIARLWSRVALLALPIEASISGFSNFRSSS